MYRLTTAIPRVAACAVCLTSAVIVQRNRRKIASPPQPLEPQRGHAHAVATRAAATLAAPAAAAAQQAWSGPVFGGVSSALVRMLCQVLRHMWLSVAIGAAASLATVNARVVSSLKQLQLATPAQISQEQGLDVQTVQQFCGQWVKVGARSDSLDSFCELFGVPKWLRQATRLMTGMQISITDDTLIVKQVCKLGWLSAVETFPLDGSCSKPQKRRDMRSGKQTGQLLKAHDGSMTVTVFWQGSLPGSAVDTLQLQETPEGPMLVVFHKAQVQGRGTAEFKEVFRVGNSQ